MSTAGQRFISAGVSGRGWSRLGDALSCLRWYGLTHGSSARADLKAPSEGRAYGIVGHTGLAHYYARRGARQGGCTASGVAVTDPEEVMPVRDAMEFEAARVRLESGYTVDVDRLFDVLKAYQAQYRNEPWRVRHVEDVFTASIPKRDGSGDWTYTGRCDLVVESANRMFVADHKFLSNIRADDADAFGMSGQFVGWRWMGEQVYGARWGGVVLNLIDRIQAKFRRPPMPAAPAMVAGFPAVVSWTEETLERLEGQDAMAYPPTMNGLTCTQRRYGPCPACKICRGVPW